MLTINQKCNISSYSPVFKENGKPADNSDIYEGIRKSISEIAIEEQEVINPKKAINKVKKVDREAVKNAGKFVGALGLVSVRFLWERLKTLGMALITWPVVLVGGLVLEAGLMLGVSHHFKYKDGDYKYKLEQIDEKAKKAESYYNSDIEKYYKETGSAIFDYSNAILQMEAERNQIQETINSLKEKK